MVKIGETIARESRGNSTGNHGIGATNWRVSRISSPVKSIVHLRPRRIIPVASRIGKPRIYYASVALDSRENSGKSVSDTLRLAPIIYQLNVAVGRGTKIFYRLERTRCQKSRLRYQLEWTSEPIRPYSSITRKQNLQKLSFVNLENSLRKKVKNHGSNEA